MKHLLGATVAAGFLGASIAATASIAGANHEDVIAEPIEASDVEVRLETVADGFTTPLWAVSPPGDDDRLVVVDQVGKIWAVDVDDGHDGEAGDDGDDNGNEDGGDDNGDDAAPERLLMADLGVDGLDLIVPLGAFGPGSFDERGLLGLAFHPDYQANGLLYTYTSEPAADFTTLGALANHHSVVREWRVPDPQDPSSVVDPASSRVLLRIEEPQFNHNAGALSFGPDGFLYIAVGDGGAADDQGPGHAEGGNGQDLSEGNVLGKILRIDPSGSNAANGRYGIPEDNPFVDAAGADEIWAYGFRNPFRFSFDTETGDLIAADVGQNDVEEIDVVERGGNYGWPIKEGTFLFDMNGEEDGFTTERSPGEPVGLIDPIAEYDHDEGISITGGFVYRGEAIPELVGSYVFGDFARALDTPGRLFHLGGDDEILELNPLGQEGVGLFVTGFGQDGDGEVYLLGQEGIAPVGETGVVQRIVPASPDEGDTDDGDTGEGDSDTDDGDGDTGDGDTGERDSDADDGDTDTDDGDSDTDDGDTDDGDSDGEDTRY